MNVILLVVDSLRSDAVHAGGTPFLHRLASEAVFFRRAYATECWTLPTHASMFTGLLPSQHQAHFQTMAYEGAEPTVAELCAAGGYQTEIVTRNPIFDGTIPGITRGFQRNVRLTAERRTLDPLSLLLAASKPRFRRQIQSTGDGKAGVVVSALGTIQSFLIPGLTPVDTRISFERKWLGRGDQLPRRSGLRA